MVHRTIIQEETSSKAGAKLRLCQNAGPHMGSRYPRRFIIRDQLQDPVHSQRDARRGEDQSKIAPSSVLLQGTNQLYSGRITFSTIDRHVQMMRTTLTFARSGSDLSLMTAQSRLFCQHRMQILRKEPDIRRGAIDMMSTNMKEATKTRKQRRKSHQKSARKGRESR